MSSLKYEKHQNLLESYEVINFTILELILIHWIMQVGDRPSKPTVKIVNNIQATIIGADAKIQKQSKEYRFRYPEK